jgi:transposase
MSKRVSLRPLTPEERQQIEALAHSRTAPARTVERAQIILAATEGQGPAQVARSLGISRPTVYRWVGRFNLQGPYGLEDQPRAGRPATYPPEQVAEVLAAALTDPRALGLPFASWTLDRLQAYLNEHKAIPIKRSRIDEILLAEGLRWRQQESWFGERVDPDFAAKRGRSSGSTPNHPRMRSSSASTRWGRRSPRPSPATSPSTPSRGPSPTAPPGPPGGPSGRSRPASGSGAGMSSGPSGRRPARR